MKSISRMTVDEITSWKPERVEWADIRELSDKIAKAFHPEKIILFGSYARNEARPDSDVDLLIIAENNEPPTKRSLPIYRLLGDYLISLDVIVRTPAEIEKYRTVPNSTIHSALREGVTLYER